MDTKINKKELIAIKTDIKLLLECLDFQKNDAVSLKQALMTLASILQASDEAKNVFRDTGGLQQVLRLVTDHRLNEVVETGMYCLGSAVERNVFSQKLLTTASVFTFLHGVLSSAARASVRKKQTASFLVLCLVSNNSFGQTLVRQSSCLHDMLSLIRTTLPKSVEEIDSELFEGMEERSLTLWSTLLSTACACVNNPLNESNQRICASLLPYLFSVLTKHSDERILRPVLSLIGQIVSGSDRNQDLVKKCGGLEIIAKKLDFFKMESATDTSARLITIQLLSTVDACLSDNESNSKRFGELGGIKLILSLISDCFLELGEKLQAVLTLAHALDAYIGNQKYVTECGGITVLIQQLTETEDEEFSKTIKYLLHMCVSSGKTSVTDAGTDLSDSECLISKMEAMKRHNDVEMLKKINELDNKLKSFESKQQLQNKPQEDVSMDSSYLLDKEESQRVSKSTLHKTGFCTDSQLDQLVHQGCPTPREKSLMQQLVKERSEKEQLEKLNFMLQENICKTHSSLTNTRLNNFNKGVKNPLNTSVSEPSIPCYNSTELQQRGSMSVPAAYPEISDVVSYKNEVSENKYNSQEEHLCNVLHMAGTENKQLRNENFDESVVRRNSYNMNSESQEIPAMVTRSGQRYHKMEDNSDMNNNCLLTDQNNHVDHSSCPPVIPGCNTRMMSSVGYDVPLSGEQSQRKSSQLMNIQVNTDNHHIDTQTNLNRETFPFVAKPLDSPYSKNICTVVSGTKQSITTSGYDKGEYLTYEERQIPIERPDSIHQESKVKTIINRNAEIQCGTPFVSYLHQSSKNDKIVDEKVVCLSDCGSQTDEAMPNCHESDTGKQSCSIKNKRILIENSKSSDRQKEGKKTISMNSFDTKNKDSRKDTSNWNSNNLRQETSSVSKQSSISNALFVKPVALPPKRKVRMTPVLGPGKLSEARSLSARGSKTSNINNNSKTEDYDSDIQSEFDLNLFKNIKKQNACVVKSTTVIKSQNNVRQIDRLLEKQESSVAEKWQVHPSTPLCQSIVPPRPAYSDCGTRRCVLGSPYSVLSQGLKRRSLDDSGIHSPRDILSFTRQGSPVSPVDSNIDGFRSNSDTSDEEDGPPNISAAVLRSSKKVFEKSENKCPGCTGVYNSEVEGLQLNSRTYNIAIETDPNTCPMHRKLRQLERIHIHRLRKSKGTKSKLKRISLSKLPVTAGDLKTREAIYDFSSECDDNISPPSDENLTDFQLLARRKKRRKRIPYTEEEEDNLLAGVRTIGKHWNQILYSYKFHPSRTNVDLMDKYKRMMASSGQATSSKCLSVRSRTHKPFSMCEERRLRRGVMKHGYNWKIILKSFMFAQGRTTEDLRNKWRTLHKKL